jgi:hypothetical protein
MIQIFLEISLIVVHEVTPFLLEFPDTGQIQFLKETDPFDPGMLIPLKSGSSCGRKGHEKFMA